VVFINNKKRQRKQTKFKDITPSKKLEDLPSAQQKPLLQNIDMFIKGVEANQ
jgi:hypothetical protein